MVLTDRGSIFSQCLHFSTLMVTNLVGLCWFVSCGCGAASKGADDLQCVVDADELHFLILLHG
jgi:hypothetical protein